MLEVVLQNYLFHSAKFLIVTLSLVEGFNTVSTCNKILMEKPSFSPLFLEGASQLSVKE